MTSPAGLRDLLVLAWPIVLQRSAQAVVGLCDALMVAPLGEDALAAVTAGAMNVSCLTIFPIGVVILVQTFAAQLSGQGDLSAARRYGWYALGISVAAGLLGLAAVPAVAPLVDTLAYDPGVRTAMVSYAAIRLVGLGFAVGLEAIGSWYGGLGNTRFGMVASLVVMVVNVAVNWVLIEGRMGAPALGVDGAAWASVLASAVGFFALLAVFLVGVGAPSASAGALRLSEGLRLLRFGVPTGLNWFLEFGAFVVFVNVTVAQLGTVTTAALLAVMQLNSVSFMPAFGLSSAAAILAGQAIGAGQRDLVPAILRRAMGVCVVWQLAVGAVYLIGATPIMGWFAARESEGPEFVRIGAVLLALSAAWQLFDALGITTGEVLRSAGDTLVPLLARLLLAWLVFVPGAHLAVTVFDGGGVAAVLAIIAYLAALSVLLMVRFHSGAWRRIELTEQLAISN